MVGLWHNYGTKLSPHSNTHVGGEHGRRLEPYDMSENPWLKLNRSERPYVLDIDKEYVQRHNKSVRPENRIMTNSIPEPYIGNPETAKVVLLNLNPGHSPKDEEDHGRPEIQNAIFHNLRHEPQEYPFYPLNPALEGTGVANWWRPRIRRLQDESGLDMRTFATRLLVIEWFPYHSERCALGTRPVCESQQYSFELAKQMLGKDGVQVVGMRSKKHWEEVDQALGHQPFLKNYQRTYITRGNMETTCFDRLLEALNDC
jgi:hypothetical protein